MSQTIQATINIPPDYVLIKKVEHEQLVERQAIAMTMKEVCEEFQRDRTWVKKNVMDKPYFRRKIEKFSQFPEGKNGQYRFHRRKMLNFIDEYYEEIIERSEEN
ncbi:DUF771 domain-containing protein [Mammaliicoccus sciuri]|uniref:DUF771 domain-containing protein n=1 Tax=Mammaliicoccus sciuri TaxID=1296 RepID=UPI0015C4B50F|nr:DUF771 domain-containing protein [Mammaliicoccus sciuri]